MQDLSANVPDMATAQPAGNITTLLTANRLPAVKSWHRKNSVRQSGGSEKQGEKSVCPKCGKDRLTCLHRKSKKRDCDWKFPCGESSGESCRAVTTLRQLPKFERLGGMLITCGAHSLYKKLGHQVLP